MKKPQLAPDAQHWYRFWSFRLAIVAAVLSAGEVVIPLFSHWLPEGILGAASGTVALLAAVARVVRQQFPPS